ncbi:MAG: hypothetical protein R3C02_01065 [Planctomycetaceae bacterium]
MDDHHLFAGDPTTGNVLVFNVEKGDLVKQIANPTDKEGISINPLIQSITMSRDGSFLMAAGQRTVKREETSLKYGGKNVSMSEVRLWDPVSGDLIRELYGREDHGFGYAGLSPDGMKVAVGDFSRLRIIDAESGDALQTIELPGWWGSTLSSLQMENSSLSQSRTLLVCSRSSPATVCIISRTCRLDGWLLLHGRLAVTDRDQPRRRISPGLGCGDRRRHLESRTCSRRQP